MTRVYWVLAVLAAVSACARPAPPDLTTVELSFEQRSPNCVNCCEFEVRFRSGGIVTFIGRRACPVPGPQRFRVPASDFEQLVQAYTAAGFFDIPRLAAPLMIDGGVTTIAYRDNQRMHETLFNVPPPRLKSLAARLRQAARADELVRPSLAKYESLVKDGWDVNTLDDDHDNALIATITAGDAASTRFLLSRGARLSDNAARLAASRAEMDFLMLAVNSFNGAAPPRPLGPLLPVAATTSASGVRALLTAGADVNWGSGQTTTALMRAISGGSLDAAALLLRAGAALEARDDQGRTAMSYAASASNTGFIAMLAARGADVNARDRFGRTPLMVATDACYEWNIPPLLAAGADPLLADSKGRTALQSVSAAIDDPKCGRTRRLVEAGAARRGTGPRVQ